MEPVHISTNVQPKLQASDSEDIPIPSSQNKFNDFFTGSQASGAEWIFAESHSGRAFQQEGFFRIVASP
ncbi:hypothetical protein PHAVU_005G025100 [Phaseolus vulgaris]|uniref:Uncharacterized protein n=1 Tax=Phaseolus vulgaris TaxID=3885 RepID=V7BWG9_PHAVU|nr:hypothetical protein PHAVU_005G025100g [Phaseolus vulgaris]ESW20911.1 hypothetical protein PHAVU_005G025100g [Phaseolus vulgaris]